MKIENVTLETEVEYQENDEYGSRTTPVDILKITVPLPGGKATYKIPLEKGQKDSMEFAAKLANEGKK